MTFSISFFSQDILGKLYNTLLDLGITIKVNILKCKDQQLRSMHVLAMLIILDRYLLLFKTTLRCLQEI